MTRKKSTERLVKNIKRITRRKYSSEEKIRIVIEGMRGEALYDFNMTIISLFLLKRN